MTPKQKLQKDRAYFKFVLTGLPKPIKIESLDPAEKSGWNEIMLIRKSLLDQFEWNSKKLGLKVPEQRCYMPGCKNKASYDIEINGEELHSCKKHLSYVD